MNTNIKRCRRCGKIFNSFGENTCAECVEELDKIFNLVQDYIYDHEDADVVEISKALDIDGKIILNFIKDGSLTLSESNFALSCERCKKPIHSGRYCNECKESLGKMFEAVASHQDKEKEEKPKKKVRMHINLDK